MIREYYSKFFDIKITGHLENVSYERNDSDVDKIIKLQFTIDDCAFELDITNDDVMWMTEFGPKYIISDENKNTTKYTYNTIKNFVEKGDKSPLENYIYLANVCLEFSKIAGLKDVEKALMQEISPKHLNKIYLSYLE